MSIRSLLGKTATLLWLLAAGDFAGVRAQLRRNLRAWRLHRARGVPFVYRLPGMSMVCVPGIADSEETYVSPELDNVELALLRTWLQPGDLFVDVGANLGIYSFAAAQQLRGEGRFVAIEASPQLVAALQVSARLLGAERIEFVQRVVGDRAGEIDFYLAPPNRSTGQQTLHPDPASHAEYRPQRLAMETLAEIARRHAPDLHPAAVKLDIEGAEPLALRGAPDAWFTADGPLWLVELNPGVLARGGSSCRDLVERFPAAAFERWLVPHHAKAGSRHLPMRALADTEEFADAWFYNLVALPRSGRFAPRSHRVHRLLQSA